MGWLYDTTPGIAYLVCIMRNNMARNILLWSTLLAVGHVQGQTSVILQSVRDCPFGYHDGYNTANSNYNSAVHFSGFAQPGASGGVNAGRSLVEFDLSGIPADSTILGAFLSLSARGPWAATGTVATVGHVGENTCVLRRVTEPWDDNTVTWNNQPATSTQNEVTLPQSTYSMQNYLNINVTALVRDMVQFPSNSHGFMLSLVNEEPSRGLIFHTGLASEVDKRPVLLVIYGDCKSSVGMSEPPPTSFGLQISPSVAEPGTMLRIDGDLPVLSGAMLVLMDASGRIVMRTPVDRWPFSIAVPAIAPGAYTLAVRERDRPNSMIGRLVVR